MYAFDPRNAVALVALSAVACGSTPGAPGGSNAPGPPAQNVWVQGHVVSVAPSIDHPQQMDIFLDKQHYDRCNTTPDLLVQDPGVEFTVPTRPGFYPDAVGANGSAVGTVGVRITHVGPDAVTGWVNSSPDESGRFVADTCGWLGQSLVKIQVCEFAMSLMSNLGSVAAISPTGVVAVSNDLESNVHVFRRNTQSTPCTYEPDPDFGSGGVVALSGIVRKMDFDGSGRLYVITDDVFARVTPGGQVDSCVVNQTPTDFTVLRDGKTAYVYNGFEERYDLTSPALGSTQAKCDVARSADNSPHFADALSAQDDGFLFLRQPDGPEGTLHAEVTTLDLTPVLRFGGSVSDQGVEALGRAVGARCPVGYCMASDRGLAMYSDQGVYLGYALFQLPAVGAGWRTWDAIEGTNGDAFVMLGADGEFAGIRISPVSK